MLFKSERSTNNDKPVGSVYVSKNEELRRLCESADQHSVTGHRTVVQPPVALARHPLWTSFRSDVKERESPVLTAVNDQHRASNFVPMSLFYWSTIQNRREDLVNQFAIRWPELRCGDPLVDDTLRGGVIAEIDPV